MGGDESIRCTMVREAPKGTRDNKQQFRTVHFSKSPSILKWIKNPDGNLNLFCLLNLLCETEKNILIHTIL